MKRFFETKINKQMFARGGKDSPQRLAKNESTNDLSMLGFRLEATYHPKPSRLRKLLVVTPLLSV